ncbi:MAG: hypothetical protein KHZ62_03360 [Clostridiales bacterium]|nr:hypothetical protein [Clostridiales bacterium]
MENLKKPVEAFIDARDEILKYFDCAGSFFIRPLVGQEWAVKTGEDFSILSYWEKSGKKVDAVVVSKSGMPMIYEKDSYTMVVAIDCVKIAFVFQNSLKQEKQMN